VMEKQEQKEECIIKTPAISRQALKWKLDYGRKTAA
jgi:hypothetical protein